MEPLIVAAFTFVQQAVSAFVVCGALRAFPSTALRIAQHPRVADVKLRWVQLSWSARGIGVFSLGTSAVVVAEAVLSGDTRIRTHARTILHAAAVCAFMVCALAGAIAGAVTLGNQVDALAGPVAVVVRVASNPLLWITLAGVLLWWNHRHHTGVDDRPDR